LTIGGNRFDRDYYGRNRSRVLFVPTTSKQTAFASVQVLHAGAYDVSALLQDVDRDLALQLTLDGRSGPCVAARVRSDEAERLVRLVRAPLLTGTHTIALRFCGRTTGIPAFQGVQSLLVAAARLQAPAQRMAGDAQMMHERPGEMRVRTNGSYLVWTDSFDDRWKGTQGGVPLNHVMVNGYANGWQVRRVGGGDVVLTFGPQRSLDAGIAVSLAFALCAIAGIAATAVPRARVRATIPGAPVERPARG
jgi:hypothetical protein